MFTETPMSTPFASLLAETAPRYTSYPTSPHFHSGIGHDAVSGWLGAVPEGDTVSLYVHIPFCDRLCWFCACHTRHTLKYEPVARYLRLLEREIALAAAALPGGVEVSALHFGGGSPTMLTPDDLRRLMRSLRAAFRFAADASISVEIDPNDMDELRLDAIAAIGTTRASLGVQDFDPKVQKAINREQGFEVTRAVIEGLRARGVDAVNIDLVYGLPHQTVHSVAQTMLQCLTLAPDRIALFGYAHVPWFKKHQTMIDEAALPDAQARLAQAECAAGIIREAGYDAIGIDHFAHPDDSLSVAARQGRLRRNFQGYTDDACETLIGLGPSSVSRFAEGYAQNAVAMGDYQRAIEASRLPIVRGIALSANDRARAWTIEQLMCGFGFSVEALKALFGAGASPILADAALLAGNEPALLQAVDGRYVVPGPARPYVRAVAARFDAYFGAGKARHSKAV
jgi:oxygen-independent coproporphyrinogen-3 oxidase